MELHIIENGETTVVSLNLPNIPLIAQDQPSIFKVFCHVVKVPKPIEHICRRYSLGTNENHHYIPCVFFTEEEPGEECNHEQDVKHLLDCIILGLTLPK